MHLSKLPTQIFALALFSTSIAVGQAAIADSTDATLKMNSVTVSYADLNLDSSFGAETLVSRIASAAKEVCGHGPYVGPGAYVLMQQNKACLKTAQRNAIAQVNRTTVTAAYAGRQGNSEHVAGR